MRKSLYIFALLFLLSPFFVSAMTPISAFPQQNTVQQQTVQTNSGIEKISDANDLIMKAADLADIVVYFLVVIAVVFIVWNVVKYIIQPADAEGKAKASLNILWGIVGLFIIVSLWGLVNILVGTFKTDSGIPTDRFPTANFVQKK